jgi:hypothetical protein
MRNGKHKGNNYNKKIVETLYKEVSKNIILNGLTDKVGLWCFGDIHRFTRSCDEDRWKWFLQSAKKKHTPNTYYLGMGDYMDFASAKEQKIFHQAGLHDGTLKDFDDTVKKRNRVLSMELSFMRPNILGLIDGNHNWTFKDGRTATEDLADRLGTQYLGWLCAYTLKFEIKYANSSKRINVYIIACHGKAGGKTEGASVNQIDELRRIFPVADFYIEAHDHQRYAKPTDVLVPTMSGERGIKYKQKRQFLCRSGSFKKAYTPDTTGYEIGRLLKPADLGALYLEISFHRDQKDGHDNIIIDTKAEI